MKLPSLADIPPDCPRYELQRCLEAMLAGLRCDPPDSFAVDWDESVIEVERLLRELRNWTP